MALGKAGLDKVCSSVYSSNWRWADLSHYDPLGGYLIEFRLSFLFPSKMYPPYSLTLPSPGFLGEGCEGPNVCPQNNDFHLSTYLAQASICSWRFCMTDLLINTFQISRRTRQVTSCLHDAVQLAILNLTCLLWLLGFPSCSTMGPDAFPLEGSPSPDINTVPFNPLLGRRKYQITSRPMWSSMYI